MVARFNLANRNGVRIPIATKLILGFLLIIVITSIVFIAVGVQLIGDRIVSEAQEMVGQDLNAAREIYLSDLRRINTLCTSPNAIKKAMSELPP